MAINMGEEVVFSKSIHPVRKTMLQWKSIYPRKHGKHKSILSNLERKREKELKFAV